MIPCLPGKAHYWDISRPDGMFSTGVCRNCEAKEEFVNIFNNVSRKGISFTDPEVSKARREYLLLENLAWLEAPVYEKTLMYDRKRR